MAESCGYCGRWADEKKDLAMHVGHFCRKAPSGSVVRAREEIEVPMGAVRYRIPPEDPAFDINGV